MKELKKEVDILEKLYDNDMLTKKGVNHYFSKEVQLINLKKNKK